MELKRFSRLINIILFVRLFTIVLNIIVVFWIVEIGRVSKFLFVVIFCYKEGLIIMVCLGLYVIYIVNELKRIFVLW